jgi:tRNA(adenine34) deaminase
MHHPCPTRRQLVAAATATAAIAPALLTPASAAANALEQPARPEDEAFMRQAIDLAKQHGKRFTALIVRDGEVISDGINAVRGPEGRLDPTAHGEMMAIRNCLDTQGAEAMRGATLYTTGESCPMCMGAIVWCRMGRVVYGVSIDRLASRMGQITIPCAEIAEQAAFLDICITGGVLADEAWALFA